MSAPQPQIPVMDASYIDEKVEQIADSTPVIKAHFLGAEGLPASNVANVEDQSRDVFERAGAIEPPYDPSTLCRLYEMSSALRSNVDAYVTNIDAFGHTFNPTLKIDSDDVDERIRNAMLVERQEEVEPGGSLEHPPIPTDEEVAQKKEELVPAMRAELTRLKAFFETCCADESFITLRRMLRQDYEVMANAYVEVLRNTRGQIALFEYVPAFTVRLLALGRDAVEVDIRIRRSELSFETMKIRRRFRRFVQIVEGKTVFFKQFGDPRVLSSVSGEFYETVEALRRVEGRNATAATELLHFKIHSPRTPYGIPRWIGTLLSVMGSRAADEVTFMYFDNKSIPPLVITVSGGRLAAGAVERIQNTISEEIKGRRNFHKILILEAEPGGKGGDSSGRVKIEIKPLTQTQQQDAFFQKYDERNMDKVGQQFRLPRMLRGDIRDFNKATAQAALLFAEMQVFEPERQEFDFIFNRKILNDLGIHFWTFQSKSPVTRDPRTLGELIASLVRVGVLLPAEGRDLAEEVFNKELKRIDAPWVNQPLQLTLADIQQSPQSAAANKPNPLAKLAKYLIDAQTTLEQEASQQSFETAKRCTANDDTESQQSFGTVGSDAANDETKDEVILRVSPDRMRDLVVES